MKKIISFLASVAVMITPFAMAMPAQASTTTWDTTGSYVLNMQYLSGSSNHDVVLVQDTSGNLTGHGGSPAGANVYTWVITSGTVSGNTINFLANYTATADAVTPQTILHVNGTIAANGTLSGTWSDNYQGSARTGTFSTVSGQAMHLITLAAQDFGVVNYDTGLGILKGYTAGFGLTNATLAGATSVVVKLYSAGDVLLQTNTAILPKFNHDITGAQFSSPFDVSGTFQYATDGYWTNVKASQYGQNLAANKVVATVTLSNGKVVTATNSTLSGDPTTIFSSVPPVVPPTHPGNKNDCKKGGWRNFTGPTYRNQGQCIKSVNHSKIKMHKDDKNENSDKSKKSDNENEGNKDNKSGH